MDFNKSFMNKSALSSKENLSGVHYEENSDAEESGWTSYFYDFLAQEKNGDEHISRSDFSQRSSIIVSDAASTAVKKCPEKNCSRLCCAEESKSNMYKELSFKKRKVKGASDDDALEDTASSPVKNITAQTRETKRLWTYGREKRGSYGWN